MNKELDLFSTIMANVGNDKLSDNEFRHLCLSIKTCLTIQLPDTFEEFVDYFKTNSHLFPIRCKVVKPFWEDANGDPGMILYIENVSFDTDKECVKVEVSFSDADLEHNRKLMERNWRDRNTGLYNLTAEEAGQWTTKDSYYMSLDDNVSNYISLEATNG